MSAGNISPCRAHVPSRSYSFALDTDVTLSAFFTGCIESPELCTLTPIFSSAGIISRRVASLVEDLKVSPLALESNNTTVTVTYGMVKSAIVSALYFPFTWSGVADLLAAVIEGNAEGLASATLSGYSSPSIFPNLAGPEVQNGIQCADKPFRYDDVASMRPVLARFEAESWIRVMEISPSRRCNAQDGNSPARRDTRGPLKTSRPDIRLLLWEIPSILRPRWPQLET